MLSPTDHSYSEWDTRGQPVRAYHDAEIGGMFTATMARTVPMGDNSNNLRLYENLPGRDDEGQNGGDGHEPRQRRNPSIVSLPPRLLGPKPFTPYQDASVTQLSESGNTGEGYKPSSSFVTRPVKADLVTSSTPVLYAPKPFTRESSGLPSAVVKKTKSPRRGARYLTISSSQPLTLETPTVKADIMNTAAGDLIRPVSHHQVPWSGVTVNYVVYLTFFKQTTL